MPAMQPADFRVVIPARYASQRFPGKALAELAGWPVIRHVHDRACQSRAAEVIIATDDRRIADVAGTFGAEVVMTRGDHQSGSDRVAEVVETRGWPQDAVIVNVQGDVPLLPPASIDQVAQLLLADGTADIATLCTPIEYAEAFRDPNVVKVVMDRDARALYFSRASIPARQGGSDALTAGRAWRHIGIYAYRAGGLLRLTREAPCYLEQVERLEQLRALWMGMRICVGIAKEAHGPDVDTPEDLAAAARFLSLHR